MPPGELLGTNGKMLDLLTGQSGGLMYSTLETSEDTPVWKSVLHHAAKESAHALIDAGGLVAGVSNRDAADCLLEVIDHSR